jgi:hypothetical protein
MVRDAVPMDMMLVLQFLWGHDVQILLVDVLEEKGKDQLAQKCFDERLGENRRALLSYCQVRHSIVTCKGSARIDGAGPTFLI